jgi:hypothetical protein
LKQEYRAPVTLLSRRPQIASRPQASRDPTQSSSPRLGDRTSEESSGLRVADLSETDEEDIQVPTLTAEERHAKALKDREEKQRKYEEVRERLFGSSSNPGSSASSPGSSTPPLSRQNQSSDSGRGSGRNRGSPKDKDNNRDIRDPSGASSQSRQLYDPGYSVKPNSSYLQRRERQPQQSTGRSDTEHGAPLQPIRNSRGPDGSGRGGFGFSHRGRGA